jgi:hypothetical protein
MLLQDGKIEAEVKLTGILSLGALQPGEIRKYGTMIAPGLYAPVHQHFFVARMDMAVDCKPGEAFNQVHCCEPQGFFWGVFLCLFNTCVIPLRPVLVSNCDSVFNLTFC